ncbi:MAG: hypothetical protein ABL986_15785 [Vicinamibacterales bacterium]
MRTFAACVFLTWATTLLAEQERPVPSDSTRVTVTGCARKSVFIVRWREDHEPTSREIADGRRFRLTGRKDVLSDVRKREGSMVELTGLVRKNAVAPPQGISIGGRVRVGIGSPQAPLSDPARNPDMYQPIFDVESYQLLPEPCSLK